MPDMNYDISPALGERATFGLVVLKTDETLEQDFRAFFPQSDIAIYATRVPNAATVTKDTLAQMAKALPASASLFPDAVKFDVVGYGCTSGTAVIGAPKVAELVKSACNTPHVTDPLSALIAQCRAKSVTRLGLVSPYVAAVNNQLRDCLRAAGIETPVFGSFGVEDDSMVARISQSSTRAAATELCKGQDVDAVFMSCTNLRTISILGPLQSDLGVPVFSSNQSLAWHMAELAGLDGDDALSTIYRTAQ